MKLKLVLLTFFISLQAVADCETVQCATETTQQLNLQSLKDIKNLLTGTSDVPDPTAPTDKEIVDAMKLGDAFSGLRSIEYFHSSECPALDIDWTVGGFHQRIYETGHCEMFSDNAYVFQTVFTAIWLFNALYIVLRA